LVYQPIATPTSAQSAAPALNATVKRITHIIIVVAVAQSLWEAALAEAVAHLEEAHLEEASAVAVLVAVAQARAGKTTFIFGKQ
jgi:hypothetical protein